MGSLDFGQWLLVGFFAWLAWLILRPKPGEDRVCTTCGHRGTSAIITKGSIWIEVVLWLCFIVPGLIYSIWRMTSRREACQVCGSSTLVPVDSPVGRELLAKYPATATAAAEPIRQSRFAERTGRVLGKLVASVFK